MTATCDVLIGGGAAGAVLAVVISGHGEYRSRKPGEGTKAYGSTGYSHTLAKVNAQVLPFVADFCEQI